MNAYLDGRTPSFDVNPPRAFFVDGERTDNVHKITHHIGVGNRGYVAHWRDAERREHEAPINVRDLPYGIIDAIARVQNQNR